MAKLIGAILGWLTGLGLIYLFWQGLVTIWRAF